MGRQVTQSELDLIKESMRRVSYYLPANGKAYVRRNVIAALGKRQEEGNWGVIERLVTDYTEGWGCRGAGELGKGNMVTAAGLGRERARHGK